jgi:hypothetical protein
VRNQSMVSSLANQVNATAAIGSSTTQRLLRNAFSKLKFPGGGKAAKAQGAVSQVFSGLGLTSLGSMLSTDDGSSAGRSASATQNSPRLHAAASVPMRSSRPAEASMFWPIQSTGRRQPPMRRSHLARVRRKWRMTPANLMTTGNRSSV